MNNKSKKLLKIALFFGGVTERIAGIALVLLSWSILGAAFTVDIEAETAKFFIIIVMGIASGVVFTGIFFNICQHNLWKIDLHNLDDEIKERVKIPDDQP